MMREVKNEDLPQIGALSSGYKEIEYAEIKTL